METKYATYKLAPKNARMNIGDSLGHLKIIPKEIYIPEFLMRLNANIKTLPVNKTKEKTNTIELF